MGNFSGIDMPELAKNGNFKDLEAAVESYPNSINNRDKTSTKTALMLAAEIGRHDLLQLLLSSRGILIDLMDKLSGQTALSFAAAKGRTESVRLLLNFGSNVDSKDNDGWTPLIWAVDNNHIDVVKLLVQKKCNPNLQSNAGQSALMCAAAKGYHEIVKFLMQNDCDLNLRNSNGQTALLCAAANGKTVIAKLLIQNIYCGMNTQNNNGDSALAWAAAKGHAEFVKLLIHNGCDLNLQTNDGNTAFMLACMKGNTDIARLLLNAGCDYQKRDFGGKSILEKINDSNLKMFVRKIINDAEATEIAKIKKSEISKSRDMKGLGLTEELYEQYARVIDDVERYVLSQQLVEVQTTLDAAIDNKCDRSQLITLRFKIEEIEEKMNAVPHGFVRKTNASILPPEILKSNIQKLTAIIEAAFTGLLRDKREGIDATFLSNCSNTIDSLHSMCESNFASVSVISSSFSDDGSMSENTSGKFSTADSAFSFQVVTEESVASLRKSSDNAI